MEVRGARAPVVINKQIYLTVLFLLPISFYSFFTISFVIFLFCQSFSLD
jgi:hypothetical protein